MNFTGSTGPTDVFFGLSAKNAPDPTVQIDFSLIFNGFGLPEIAGDQF